MRENNVSLRLWFPTERQATTVLSRIIASFERNPPAAAKAQSGLVTLENSSGGPADTSNPDAVTVSMAS